MYPKKLTPVLNRLGGYNNNVYKIMPLNADAITSGKIISVRLPSNALVDMSSFAMHFDVVTLGGDSAGEGGCRLPNNLSTLIERVEVLCGGQTIQQGFNGYGTAKHILDTVGGSSCKRYSRQVLDHPSVVGTSTNLFDSYGAAIAVTADEKYEKGPSFIITDWLGFIGESVPKVLDLGLMSEVQIRITLANTNVLVKAATGSKCNEFTLSGVYFTLNTLSVDGVYETLLEDKIKRDGFLEIPYKNYFTTFSSHSGSTRFSNSSQSIDKIYAVLRDSSYNTNAEADPVSTGPGKLHHTNTEISRYLKFNASNNILADGTLQNHATTPALRAAGTGAVTHWQFQINNVLYPQYLAKPLDAYRMLELAADSKVMEIPNMQAFLDQYAIFPVRLNCDNEIGHINGFDSRNTNSIMEFTTNSQQFKEAFILVETTATLKVGAGKAMEIVL